MYQLDGSDFTDLIKREFTENFVTREAAVSIDQRFDLGTKTFRDEHFDILHFKSNVHSPHQINNMEDTTHVSLHFQFSGYSAAHISGFKSAPGTGKFNLLNCVDPLSTFVYPEKGIYEYLCVAFEPSYFDHIIGECENSSDGDLIKKRKSNLFHASCISQITDYWQMNTIKLIQEPPIADALKIPYIRSKVKELSLLTLAKYTEQPIMVARQLNAADLERIRSVKDYLMINYLSKLSLEGLSRMFGLNEFKLKSGFKKVFGITVFGYIQKLRLEHAAKMLMDGGFTVVQIAFTIGYESDTAFIRAFKLHFNTSPGKINKSFF